jgi:hypothetical protein
MPREAISGIEVACLVKVKCCDNTVNPLVSGLTRKSGSTESECGDDAKGLDACGKSPVLLGVKDEGRDGEGSGESG